MRSGWPRPIIANLVDGANPELAPSPRFADMAWAIRPVGRRVLLRNFIHTRTKNIASAKGNLLRVFLTLEEFSIVEKF